MNIRIYFFAVSSLLIFSSLFADDAQQEAMIKKKTEAYVEAFNQRDAKALASFWAEDGEYVNPESGDVVTGRTAIEEAFKSRFQAIGDTQAKVTIHSVAFPSKDEALEIGVFHVTRPNSKLRESAFKAFFENQNGDWLISEIRDVDIETSPDHYQHLKELEWLIGDWIDEDEDVEIETSYQWDSSKNFILGKFSVKTEGTLELEGSHIIGWDPVKQKIRSWIFDTDGTFGESLWTKKENKWIAETVQKLADGKLASAINLYTPIDINTYSWESTGREVGGKILPDIDPTTVKRKKS